MAWTWEGRYLQQLAVGIGDADQDTATTQPHAYLGVAGQLPPIPSADSSTSTTVVTANTPWTTTAAVGMRCSAN